MLKVQELLQDIDETKHRLTNIRDLITVVEEGVVAMLPPGGYTSVHMPKEFWQPAIDDYQAYLETKLAALQSKLALVEAVLE